MPKWHFNNKSIKQQRIWFFYFFFFPPCIQFFRSLFVCTLCSLSLLIVANVQHLNKDAERKKNIRIWNGLTALTDERRECAAIRWFIYICAVLLQFSLFQQMRHSTSLLRNRILYSSFCCPTIQKHSIYHFTFMIHLPTCDFYIYVTYKSDVSFILISFTNDRLKGVCQLLASSLNLLATICLFYKRICRFDGSFPLSTMLFNNLHCSLVVLLLLLSKINSFLLKFVGFFACFFPPLNVWNRKLYQWYVCISSNLSKHISGSEYKQTNEKMKQIMMTTNYLLF